MTSGEEQHVRLPHPIRVHLMYWTARVDGAGVIRFLEDIYGHDARQWADYQSRIARVKKQKDRIRAAAGFKDRSKKTSASSARAAGGG
jgi:murein L,D-transpeptidase YcbB/YkuD